MGTIPRIVAHLELDGAGIATGPALREHEERELVEQRLEAAGQRARRRLPRRVPEGSDGEEGVAIAQAHRGHTGARRRAAHSVTRSRTRNPRRRTPPTSAGSAPTQAARSS